MSDDRRLFECYTCKNNGFPNEMVQLAGKDERGAPIRKQPDGSPHTHKTKLARRSYDSTTRVPMTEYKSQPTQPLVDSSSKTTDERIAQYHKENVEGYAEYRKVMKEQVEATYALAEAIRELAHTFKIKNRAEAEGGGGGGGEDI